VGHTPIRLHTPPLDYTHGGPLNKIIAGQLLIGYAYPVIRAAERRGFLIDQREKQKQQHEPIYAARGI